MHLLDRLRADGNDAPWTVVATAHPAKFESVVEPLIGRPVEVPVSLAAMLQRSASAEAMPAHDDALRRWLLERAARRAPALT
jgi:threonine synthase